MIKLQEDQPHHPLQKGDIIWIWNERYKHCQHLLMG